MASTHLEVIYLISFLVTFYLADIFALRAPFYGPNLQFYSFHLAGRSLNLNFVLKFALKHNICVNKVTFVFIFFLF